MKNWIEDGERRLVQATSQEERRLMESGIAFLKASLATLDSEVASPLEMHRITVDSVGFRAAVRLSRNGIKTFEQASQFDDSEILNMYGIGKKTLAKIRTAQAQALKK